MWNVLFNKIWKSIRITNSSEDKIISKKSHFNGEKRVTLKTFR